MTRPQTGSIFELDYPHSVQVFDSYADAEAAVDFLADNEFEVKNLCIVGTNLRSVERVLERRTWGSVIARGALSGVMTGLLIGILMMMFTAVENPLVVLLAALAISVLLSIVFQAIGYGMSGGRRDFTSVSQTIATQYEVLCEHKVVQQARDLLATRPGAVAAAMSGQGPTAPHDPEPHDSEPHDAEPHDSGEDAPAGHSTP